MRTLSARSRVIVLSSFLAICTVVGFACTVEEENPATTRPRGPDASANSSGSTGEGGGEPTGAPVCGKYGAYAGAQAIADQILATAKGDCRIATPLAGSDDAHASQCFQLFVGGNFQCPGVSFSLGISKDSNGEKCNSRLPGVDLSDIDFNVFLVSVQGAMKAKGVSDVDIKALLPAFEQARQDLVTNDVPKNKHTACAANCALGGEACIRPIIDAGNDGALKDGGGDSGDGGDGGDGGSS